MPHTPSAWKRLRKSEKRRRQNRAAAKKIKLQRKTADAAVKSGDAANTAKEFKTTQAMLDRAADKGYIHPNKAARLKSRLVKRIRAAASAPAPKAEEKK
jgi:small subunit ribosomal protein S20